MSFFRRKRYQLSSFYVPFFALISLFLKKERNKWGFLISDTQGFDGNIRALFDYAYKDKSLKPYIIDARHEDNSWIEKIYPEVSIVRHDCFSFSTIRLRLSCGAYVISHGYQLLGKGFLKLNRAPVVNVWHGIPLKGMGNLEEFISEKDRNNYLRGRDFTDLFFVSSLTEKSQIAGCFFLSGNKISVTGIPRNDWLLMPSERLPNDVKHSLSKLNDELGNRKLVLYAPTWREYDRSVIGFSQEEIKELDVLLARNNAVLGVRAHPRDHNLLSEILKSSSNVIDCSYRVYRDPCVLLKRADILVTDYSSIWVDFLLMERPIIGYVFDHDKYENNRGLMFDYETIFPGYLCNDFSSFAEKLEAALRESSNFPLDKAKWCKSLLHAKTTPSICSKVAEEVMTVANEY